MNRFLNMPLLEPVVYYNKLKKVVAEKQMTAFAINILNSFSVILLLMMYDERAFVFFSSSMCGE